MMIIFLFFWFIIDSIQKKPKIHNAGIETRITKSFSSPILYQGSIRSIIKEVTNITLRLLPLRAGLNKKIKNANGDLDDLVSKQRKMEDQIKELNRKLDENHTNQNDKSKQIDDLKSQLNELQNRLDALH